MKKLSVLFAAVMMLMTVGVAKAQKVASMDYEAVLAAMPETKKMTTDLDTFSKTKGDELNKQAEAFQKEVQAYQAEGAKMTEAQRTAKESELQKKQQNLQQLQQTAQQDLASRRDTAVKPIIEKLNNAVNKVAKANGFDFIIDATALIYKGGPDATPLVKKELGL
ncbi:MAG TPA: OmpH family outer membrane protein [Kaistella sp.]|jgi:outer membrane protein|uniref:OmpH family outer membrane protein n=1 Tax=Candidatus Kaistella beijingensis TaxID=2820270 RepID=UPI000EC180D5|nr:OmpH family outer membrane protein [Candidatus Kaistella beijingensis]HCN12479.1 molecular chaperone Skp [Chryseobacterium sp.]HMU06754.1 OmpH family outer membrane protein [Kaistella sp.]UBB88760.1 OmpH family outer membrane protein [Candidatus Kaistella beijingensis]HOB24296.1 OmpH family outer membrane protein [Kaistella sp.]HQD44372.1 OmpH family outer membrane protein [Kaistella sp.]